MHGHPRHSQEEPARLSQEAGLSQEELADAAGLHRTYVSGVERGVRSPTVEVLDKIAKPLNIPTWKLLDDGKD